MYGNIVKEDQDSTFAEKQKHMLLSLRIGCRILFILFVGIKMVSVFNIKKQAISRSLHVKHKLGIAAVNHLSVRLRKRKR